MAAIRPPTTYGIWLPTDVPLTLGDITISNLSDDHRALVEVGDLWVPRSFTATFDRRGLPILTLDIKLLNNRFHCVQLRASARREGDFIETRHLRAARVATLVKEAAVLVCYFRSELVDQEDVDFARTTFSTYADLDADPIRLDDIRIGDYFRHPALEPLLEGDVIGYAAYVTLARDALTTAGRTRRKGFVTDEDVAGVYRAAYAQNREVISAVADEFGWRRQTAKNRIRAARKKGLLPTTVPGSRRA